MIVNIRCFSLTAFTFLLTLAVSSCLLAQADIQYVTDEYPPYIFSEGGQLKGISVDILKEMHDIAEVPLDISAIKVLPWRRAYKTALKKAEHAVFPTVRIPLRESDFHWVGPIIKTKVVIFSVASPTPLHDIRQLFSSQVGVIKKDIGEDSLIEAGFPTENLIRFEDVKELIQALHSHQLTYIAYEENVARWFINQIPLPQGDFNSVYILSEGELYYSYNTAMESIRLERLQQALNSLKVSEDGSPTIYQRIIDQYF